MSGDAQVLIVGAGPTGLMAAAELVRQGVRCRIIDKASQGSTTSKALAVQARTLEYLERLGLAKKAVEAGLLVHGLRIFSDQKPVANLQIDAIHSVYNFILILPQSATERLLRDYVEQQGVRVEYSTELTGFTQGRHHVEARLNHGGEEELVVTPWLLGCDGPHSTIRHAAQIPFDGQAFEEAFSLTDTKLDWDGPRDRPTIYLHAGCLAALFPMPGDLWRIIVETHSTEAADPTLEEFQRALDTWGPANAKAHDAIWMSRFKISQRQVTNYRKGRILLVGDAAHIHSPIGGQGMNTGIQDAVNLAWKLALDLQGARPPASSIATMRSANSSASDSFAQREWPRRPSCRRIRWSSPRDALARVMLSFGFVRQRIQKAVSQTGVNYRGSAIVHESLPRNPDPSAGDRASEMPAGSKHLLLCATAANPVSRAAGQKYSAFMDIKTTSAGLKSGSILCIRPDGYVGLRCRDGDVDALDDYMSKIVALPG